MSATSRDIDEGPNHDPGPDDASPFPPAGPARRRRYAEGAGVAVNLYERQGDGTQLVERARLGTDGVENRVDPLALFLLDDGKRELFFGGEVEVERSLGQSAARDEFGHRGLGIPAFGEHLGRNLQQKRAGGGALRGDCG